MKPHPQDHERNITEDQLVEEYFAAIRERQQIEKEYFRTADPQLLAKIEQARERIREVERLMGITTD